MIVLIQIQVIKYGAIRLMRILKILGSLLQRVVIKSSNIGSIMILEKINKKIFYDLLEHVGIGEKINLNFPSEVEGYLSHHSEWKKSDIRSLAQGYSC